RALRLAGRTRRVDDHAAAVAAARIGDLRRRRGERAVPLDDLGGAAGRVRGKLADDDHRAALVGLGAGGDQRRELVGVYQGRAGLGVGQDVRDLGWLE